MIVITADRGLCGSFNSNVIKAAGQFILNEAPGRDIALGSDRPQGTRLLPPPRLRRALRGRRHLSEDDVRRRVATSPDAAIEEFTSGSASSVYLVYNEFKSVMTQRIVVERLLPIPRLESDAADAGPAVDYLYEPAPADIFRDLLPRHVQIQVWRALLESNAAFFAAQMTAMDAATRNSADMLENLTLYMNKVRQAAITREIIRGRCLAQAATQRHNRPSWRSRPSGRPAHDNRQRSGKVVQVIGPVIDVEFPEGLPQSTTRSASCRTAAAVSGKIDVVAEVEQHLGENRVRAVAMKPTDGMTRGMEVIDTGAPISVPVGPETLGRVLNVLGEPVDFPDRPVNSAGAVAHPPSCADARAAVHRAEDVRDRHQGHRSPRAATCRAARSACSAAPASARPSSSWSSFTTSR